MKPKTIVIGMILFIVMAALSIIAILHLFSAKESGGQVVEEKRLPDKNLNLVLWNSTDASLNGFNIPLDDLEPVLTRILSESEDLEPGKAVITAATDSIRTGSLLGVFGLFQEAGLNSAEFILAGKKPLSILLAGISDDDSVTAGRKNICRIMLDSRNQWIMDGQSIDGRSMKKNLKMQLGTNPDLMVHIKSDSGLEVSEFYSMLKMIRNSGIKNMVFINERKPVYTEVIEEIMEDEEDDPEELYFNPDLPAPVPPVQ